MTPDAGGNIVELSTVSDRIQPVVVDRVRTVSAVLSSTLAEVKVRMWLLNLSIEFAQRGLQPALQLCMKKSQGTLLMYSIYGIYSG